MPVSFGIVDRHSGGELRPLCVATIPLPPQPTKRASLEFAADECRSSWLGRLEPLQPAALHGATHGAMFAPFGLRRIARASRLREFERHEGEPSAVLILISTAFLPSCLAAAMSAFTSSGCDTVLPETSRITSPLRPTLARRHSVRIDIDDDDPLVSGAGDLFGRGQLDAQQGRAFVLRASALAVCSFFCEASVRLNGLFRTVAKIRDLHLVAGLQRRRPDG